LQHDIFITLNSITLCQHRMSVTLYRPDGERGDADGKTRSSLLLMSFMEFSSRSMVSAHDAGRDSFKPCGLSCLSRRASAHRGPSNTQHTWLPQLSAAKTSWKLHSVNYSLMFNFGLLFVGFYFITLFMLVMHWRPVFIVVGAIEILW